MFKDFLKITIVTALMMHLIPGSSAAETSSYNFAFSETNSNIAMPGFDLSLGTLNSVTYSIDNMNLTSTVILDLDDNDGPFSINNAIAVHTIGVGPIGSPAWASLFNMSRYVSDSFISDDDGDGIGARNGGNDEIIDTSAFIYFSGAKSLTDSEHLNALSGDILPVTFVGPVANYVALPLIIGEQPRSVERYWEDVTYSGNFTVTYDYTPVAPEPISSLLFIAGGATLIGRRYIKRKKIEG